jgi:quinol monooxygenase YgiN
MFARMVTVHFQAGKLQEGIAIFRDSIVPASQKQKGTKGLRLLTDAATNKAVVVSMWETEEDLKASEASGYYQEQVAKIAKLLTQPPHRETFEVSIYI